MKLIAQVKLQTTLEQLAALKQTMREAHRACDYISAVAWEHKTFNPDALHKLVYQDVRNQFGLSAQVTVRCIAKVADSFKLDKKRKRKFNFQGAITYDDRILSWQLEQSQVSIWTTNGRPRFRLSTVWLDFLRTTLVSFRISASSICYQT